SGAPRDGGRGRERHAAVARAPRPGPCRRVGRTDRGSLIDRLALVSCAKRSIKSSKRNQCTVVLPVVGVSGGAVVPAPPAHESHKFACASLGMRQSPRGDTAIVPTLGP